MAFNGAIFSNYASRSLSCIPRRCKHFRVACASGFWGDTAVSTPQLIRSSPSVDFIVYDYLSEITMSLLARAKAKDPKMGFCPDFVSVHMLPYLEAIKTKGIRVVSNAGGLNPIHCAEALQTAAKEKNVALKVAAITGDDMTSNKEVQNHLMPQLNNISPKSIVSMNAYLGAGPIRKALDLGADIVITGRCVDSALILGPLMHEYNWSPDQLDLMATGSLAGHLIECGAQCTGGIFTDWQSIPDWDNIGFPIAEFEKSESKFVITKPDKTGGKVNFGTVAEQLVYEIGDPESYLLPDVTADFRNVRITETTGRENAVQVEGVLGRSAPDTHKVTATYMDGFRATAVCPVIGGEAADKGRATAEAILKRCSRIFASLKMPDFRRTLIQVIGSGELFGPLAPKPEPCRECVIWMAVEHSSRDALNIFAREIAPAGTGMAPGLTNIAGGRPSVSPVLKHISLFAPKHMFSSQVLIDGQVAAELGPENVDQISSTHSAKDQESPVSSGLDAGSDRSPRRLAELAFARSGDKGDTVNIGVIARDPKYYPLLKQKLTEQVVSDYFAHYTTEKSTIKRYELPGVCGLNFVLEQTLGGGGIASLRCDPQGKAFAQMLLDCQI